MERSEISGYLGNENFIFVFSSHNLPDEKHFYRFSVIILLWKIRILYMAYMP